MRLVAMDKQIYNEPSDVNAEGGEVLVKGPDGVDVSFTPKAAEETSNRLLDGAVTARGQQIEDEWEVKRRTNPD